MLDHVSGCHVFWRASTGSPSLPNLVNLPPAFAVRDQRRRGCFRFQIPLSLLFTCSHPQFEDPRCPVSVPFAPPRDRVAIFVCTGCCDPYSSLGPVTIGACASEIEQASKHRYSFSNSGSQFRSSQPSNLPSDLRIAINVQGFYSPENLLDRLLGRSQFSSSRSRSKKSTATTAHLRT